MFPTDNDIHRLISMKDADSGFFVLAVYSFIEAHMKFQMKECGLTVAKDDTFQTISGEYQRLFQRRFGRLSPKEQTFFREMKRRKQDTNRVRHEFAALSVEEARCAAGNLLLFYTIVDEEVKGKLRPLETFLGEWGSRNPPADSGKELLEANQRIQELGAQLQELMEQSQEYQQFKVEFQRLERRCQLAELEKRDSEEKAASYHRQLEEYRQLQEESQTKFGQYEDYICRLQRMVTYTRTRNEFERALLRLTAEQEEAVSRITFKKDYLVKGSAGTGKSLVLLKTIEKLLSQSSGTCVPLFVTFTKSLVKYNAYVASLMEMGLSEKSIRTADSFFVSIMEHIFPGQGIDYKIDLKDKYAKPLRNFLRETYPQQELDVNDV
ncbi:MAG: UvrD-helicase domain-containing protein, partial [Spirochaetaceae bacterium]|nr:UvrD-helicase domain-containing protein [Spirochaetaceae bacterium]